MSPTPYRRRARLNPPVALGSALAAWTLAVSGCLSAAEAVRDSRGHVVPEAALRSYDGAETAGPAAAPFDGDSEREAVAALVDRLPALKHARGTRWPLLVWHHTPRTAALCQAMIDRGIAPLWNTVTLPARVREYAPALRHFQDRQVPLVILAQGWVQRAYREPPSGMGCDHLPPARPSHRREDELEPNRDVTCPAWMYENPSLPWHRKNAEATCQALKALGITPASMWLDFESGAYLRNGAEGADRVQVALTEALKCPRCVGRFTPDALRTPQGYSDVVDAARAAAIRTGFVEPVHAVFPACSTGNFFAHPVRRQGPAPALFPAYGYEKSGMTVAQPRAYFTPGWGGAGKDQAKTDWNVFFHALKPFSDCARVLRPGETMVPWIGYVWSNAAAQAKARAGFPVATSAAYRELAIHILLRGAETLAIFAPDEFTAALPQAYDPMPRHELGAFFLNVVDAQAGYDDVLAFESHVRTGRVLNLEMPGEFNRLDETCAVWSGVGTAEKALVRTVSFGPELQKGVDLFGRRIVLSFRRTGAFFWVFPDGRVEAAP